NFIKKFSSLFGFSCFLICTSVATAQVLTDRDGDGTVRLLAFGDSITAGVGDGTRPGEDVDLAPPPTFGGYPTLLELLLSTPVDNEGRSGEVFGSGGLERLISLLRSRPSDVLLLFEGVNDALFQVNPSEY